MSTSSRIPGTKVVIGGETVYHDDRPGTVYKYRTDERTGKIKKIIGRYFLSVTLSNPYDGPIIWSGCVMPSASSSSTPAKRTVHVFWSSDQVSRLAPYLNQEETLTCIKVSRSFFVIFLPKYIEEGHKKVLLASGSSRHLMHVKAASMPRLWNPIQSAFDTLFQSYVMNGRFTDAIALLKDMHAASFFLITDSIRQVLTQAVESGNRSAAAFIASLDLPFFPQSEMMLLLISVYDIHVRHFPDIRHAQFLVALNPECFQRYLSHDFKEAVKKSWERVQFILSVNQGKLPAGIDAVDLRVLFRHAANQRCLPSLKCIAGFLGEEMNSKIVEEALAALSLFSNVDPEITNYVNSLKKQPSCIIS